MSSLQQQVDALYSNLSSLRSNIDSGMSMDPMTYNQQQRLSRSLSGSTPTVSQLAAQSMPKHPRFHGPTSAVFNLGVAKSSLQSMGITGTEDNIDEALLTNDGTPAGSPPPMHSILTKPAIHTAKDPIWSISKDEAVRLVRVWQDEMGCMYPVVEFDKMINHINMLYTFMDAARRSGLMMPEMPGQGAISDDETNLLKIMLATATMLEGSGSSELGTTLFSGVSVVVESLLLRPPDLKCLQILILAAMFHFHRDDEVLAWRLTGFAARMCVELGLHRHETYETIFTTNPERYHACILFWSIYVLDRRWSFGIGMPFVLQESDIDPMLLKPVRDFHTLGTYM
jgi:hypothetical protein